jgi:hypothetical protein
VSLSTIFTAKAQSKVLGEQRIQRAQTLIDSLPVSTFKRSPQGALRQPSRGTAAVGNKVG